MRWIGRTVAATLVAASVVLLPVYATPAHALGEVYPPVDPYPVLPSTAVKTGAGVLDGSKSWAQAYAEVQRDVVKTGKPVAPPLAQAGKVLRGANLSIKGNVLIDGFTIGFTVGSLGVRGIYALAGVDSFDTSVCGDPIQGVTGLLYPDLMPDCTAPIQATEINADVTAYPVGWTAAPVIEFPAGSYWGTWSSAGIRFGDISGSPLPLTSNSATRTLNATSAFMGTFGTGNYEAGLEARYQIEGKKSDGSWISLVSQTFNVARNGDLRWGDGTPQYGKSNTGPFTIQRSQYPAYRISLYTSRGVLVASWYPEGTPDRPKGASGDPLRTAKCRVTMKDGSVREGFIGQYRETEGFPVGAVSAACEDASGNAVAQGLLPDTIEITSTNPDTGKTDTISTTKVPDFTESEKVGLNPGNNTGLRLLKVVNGVTQSCMTWEATCAGWWQKTSSGTVTTTDEGEYRCEYGGRVVALAECGVYRATFDVATDSPTVTDPVTGAKTDWSSTPDKANEYNSGGQSNQASDRCITSFSWNPVDWVLRPIRCAFEPRKEKVDEAWAKARASWDKTMPVRITTLAATAFTVPQGVSGCDGIDIFIPFSTVGAQFGWADLDWRVFDACSGPAATVAQWARWIGSAILLYVTALGVVRRASAVVNAPGLGGGGDSP